MKSKNDLFVLDSQEIKYLSPYEREEYIRNVLIELLSAKNNGITIPEAVELTRFNRVTLAKHLEYLTSIREAYKRKRGGVTIYFKNGRLVHPTSNREIFFEDKKYSFLRLENDEGEFIYIQENKKDDNDLYKVNGGIIIALKNFQDFLNGLIGFTMEFDGDGENGS